jgi:hypothetical protein
MKSKLSGMAKFYFDIPEKEEERAGYPLRFVDTE